MTRDDIKKLAQQADLPSCHTTHPKALERFALLVADHERQAIIDNLGKWADAEKHHPNYWRFAINYIAGRGQQ
jgi:hypothetical protein